MHPQLVRLFRDALDLAPQARSAYLDALDIAPDLRAQIAGLLLVAEQTEVPLPDLTLQSDALTRRNAELADRSGEQIGAFRLLKPLGSGGMGAVWLAERSSGFSQKVAIKWLHGGLSASARQRFARERETLAMLEHPGIARIVDGGSDADADWFAMEYVDGVTLDAYVKRMQPSLSARIGLIVALCDAVQYAHQNLIVHRDLKPGNILVSASGQPKLLDFGVAKVLGDSNVTVSRAPMTFAYAAPEQIRGDAITTATDVYALGVILFELLTGERPHKAINRVGGDGSLSLLQAITDTDATAPSHVLSLRTHTETKIRPKQLKGDLDTIVLKALSRDPARRYASAQALAEDLAAYLRQMPIRARPETWRYRSAKFVRRHLWGVSLGGLALAIVAALSIVSVIQAGRAQRQQRLAEAQAQRATAVQDFLIGLFEQQRPDATRGASVSAKDLLDRAETKLEQGNTLNVATRGTLLKTLAQLRFDLGDYPAALKLGNQSVQLAEAEFGADSPAHALALVERSLSLRDSGEPGAAIADCDRALPTLRAAQGIAPEFFAALRDCAALKRDNDNLDAAAELLNEATQVLERLPPDRLRRYSLLNASAILAIDRDDNRASISIYDQYIRLLRADPNALPSDLSSALHSRATAKRFVAQIRSAIADYREALSIQERIFGPAHLLTIQSMGSLANQLYEVGDVDEAARLSARALLLARGTLAADNPALGIILNDAAISAYQRQDIAGAIEFMQEAIDVNTRAFGNAHSDTLLLMCNLSSLQRKFGRFDASRATAMEVLARSSGAESVQQFSRPWREAHNKLASVADRIGDAATQLSHAKIVIAALPTAAAVAPNELPQALAQQAQALIRLGKIREAQQSAAQLEALTRARFEAGTSQRAGFLAIVAWVAIEAGDAKRALALSQESLGAAPIAAASWSNFDSLIAAMVQWRALTALHQDAAAKPWAIALRERHKTALAEEAGYWQAVELVLAK